MVALEGVTFRLGPPGELPGFTTLVTPVPVQGDGGVDEIDFHERGPGLEAMLDELRGHELVLDGMVFAWLVAVANSTDHHPEGFCYTRSAWVETNFKQYQHQVPVYFLAPGIDMYQRLVAADTPYCGQWLVRDGDRFLGLTDEGPLSLPAAKWQEFLARKVTAQGMTGGGDEDKAQMFKDLMLGMLQNKQYYLWPRGLVGDPTTIQQPPPDTKPGAND